MTLVDTKVFHERYVALVSDGFSPDESVAAMRHIDRVGTMFLWPLLLGIEGLDRKQAMKRMIRAIERLDQSNFITTQSDLKRLLADTGVPESSYSFESDGIGEVFRLAKTDTGWITYYAERGLKTSERIFATDLGAFRHFFSWITNSKN